MGLLSVRGHAAPTDKNTTHHLPQQPTLQRSGRSSFTLDGRFG
jgi:hypothetical protein